MHTLRCRRMDTCKVGLLLAFGAKSWPDGMHVGLSAWARVVGKLNVTPQYPNQHHHMPPPCIPDASLWLIEGPMWRAHLPSPMPMLQRIRQHCFGLEFPPLAPHPTSLTARPLPHQSPVALPTAAGVGGFRSAVGPSPLDQCRGTTGALALVRQHNAPHFCHTSHTFHTHARGKPS